ncbi:Rieske 2Fe-2S domain-containing protein [bacterium]|nr:Rieske 2Fe-2S domain-containing protein [bacterium]
MAVGYSVVGWNKQKRVYDLVIAGSVVAAVGAFVGVTARGNPFLTAETIIIRATALAAFLLLHIILCIGPLARLDERFLPLLYNRRHLGVTMFLIALIHAAFSTLQFHGFGDANPLVSLFTAYASEYRAATGLPQFPFEIFGAAALVILFLMAATSHDFWLKNLGPILWKRLHMMVYAAYLLIVLHIVLGAMQSERSIALPALTAMGFAVVSMLHLAAARRERRADRVAPAMAQEHFVDVCAASDVEEGCGKVVAADGERIALFRHKGKIFALSNVCRHQGGPLGEGRIVDGCATCPWHGWNYKVEDGTSPPPFHEIVPTFPVRVVDGRVQVRPEANPLETRSEGAEVTP